eukprot:INCI16147.2.p1 GENE.INCI16147.2~~INCI16147.2.p1  ORF type:complete len:357 (+),score=63.71 INCI16147.2:133-1203(+)
MQRTASHWSAPRSRSRSSSGCSSLSASVGLLSTAAALLLAFVLCCGFLPTAAALADESPADFLKKLKKELHVEGVGGAASKPLARDSTEKVTLPASWDATGGNSWTHAVVLEDHKLIFCAMPKCGSTQWRKMLRRLNGAEENYLTRDPHNPAANGLQLLNKLPLSKVEELINDPEYTKAVFVRSPLTRLLSGYRDKLEARHEFHRMPIRNQLNSETLSFSAFVELVVAQKRDVAIDEHWRRESAFCGLRYFDYDFVGYFEDLEADSRKLLQDLGLYDRYAASGWGPNGDEKFLNSLSTAKSATLTGSQHATALAKYYDVETLERVNEFFDEDFRRFHFHKFDFDDLLSGNITSFHD